MPERTDWQELIINLWQTESFLQQTLHYIDPKTSWGAAARMRIVQSTQWVHEARLALERHSGWKMPEGKKSPGKD